MLCYEVYLASMLCARRAVLRLRLPEATAYALALALLPYFLVRPRATAATVYAMWLSPDIRALQARPAPATHHPPPPILPPSHPPTAPSHPHPPAPRPQAVYAPLRWRPVVRLARFFAGAGITHTEGTLGAYEEEVGSGVWADVRVVVIEREVRGSGPARVGLGRGGPAPHRPRPSALLSASAPRGRCARGSRPRRRSGRW